MLVTLLAWLLITIICWAWGMLVLQRLQAWLKDDVFTLPSFSIVCFSGFAFVTVLSGILSLWMPLGGWMALLIIIAPCLLLFLQKKKINFFVELKKQFAGSHPLVIFLFAVSLLMVLVMCTWKINHPDTLAYHAQTIHWIEKYKIIPGLVHLYTRYGYQGQWFVACSLFSFRFTGTEALTFINSAILIWYLLFVMQKINTHLEMPGKRIIALLWLSLLAASCLSYTQVRLTASSASPDFIATLLILTVIYLLLEKNRSFSITHWLLIILLSVFSITVKLSAAPLLLVAIYGCIRLLRLKKIKAVAVSFFFGALILFPFIARNIITTGYLVFPSPFPDIVNVDWKFDKERTALEKDYITAYARTHVDYTKADIENVMAMSPGRWLPVWWRNTSGADKAILYFFFASCVIMIAGFRMMARSSSQTKIALLASTAGIAFWFLQAPDTRFGFGFILSFTAIGLSLLATGLNAVNRVSKKLVASFVLLSALVIAVYTGYRFVHFFSLAQAVRPAGIEKNSPATFRCENVLFNKPANNELCGDLPLPCVYTDSCDFIFRGDKITNGFKVKQ